MLKRSYDEELDNPAITPEQAAELDKVALRKQALENLIGQGGMLPEVDEVNRLNALPNSEMSPAVEIPEASTNPLEQEDRLREMMRYQKLFGPKN
jgi:hypothetical protein